MAIDPISAAMLAITIGSEGMKFAQGRKDKKRQRAADAEEAAAIGRIEQEITNADVPTAGDQQAVAALNRRIANRREQVQAGIGRDNIAGSPAAEARLRETDTEAMRSNDALVTRLAEMRDARRLRAIYELPGLKRLQALKTREDSNPNTEALDAISGAAAGEFWRTDSPFRKLFGGAKSAPAADPTADLAPKKTAVASIMPRPSLPMTRPAGDMKAGSGYGSVIPPVKARSVTPSVNATLGVDKALLRRRKVGA